MSYNLVVLVGNLTRDVSLRYTPSGSPVAEFGLAVNHSYKDKDGNKKEDPYFANITVFGVQAENCSKYLSKGNSALVEGRITEQRWEKDGEKKSKTVIQAKSVKFLGSKGQGKTEGGKSEEEVQPSESTDLEPF
jgi:single-strand DNA-binding protein